jgi:hypothetical protein
VLSAAREFVSRCLHLRSTSTTFDSTVWHTHLEYWSTHNPARTSHSFPITFLYILLFRFLCITSLYSRNIVVHQMQLHRLGLQLGTTARTYHFGLRGKYCCLFALYVDRGYTPQQFVGLLAKATLDKLVSEMFASVFGLLHKMLRNGGQCSKSIHNR